jgi:hypothetical protein
MGKPLYYACHSFPSTSYRQLLGAVQVSDPLAEIRLIPSHPSARGSLWRLLWGDRKWSIKLKARSSSK